jgi:TRAP-type C4-dicarboxylate transport system permease small subunit
LWQYPLEVAVSVILVGIVAVTFAQVVFRYVLMAPLSWSEELARFLLLWLASLSAAYAFKLKSHFALTFVVDWFDESIQRHIRTLVTFIVAGFLLIFIRQAFSFTLAVRDQIAPGTQMSMAIPYSSALVGSILMFYYVVKNWWDEFRGVPDPALAADSGQDPATEPETEA